jgi:Holliday junction resolvase RusA-like endonuclease
MAADALNGLIYKDDALATDMHVTKRYSENPRMEIKVFV